MKFLRIIAVAVGLALAGYLLHQVGLGEVRHSLGLLGWGYVLILAYPAVWTFLNTRGWRSALKSRVPFVELFLIRVAGETFNSLLPSGYVGGEPLKVKLLSRRVPVSEAASSVLIAKAGQSVALVFFVTLGLTIGNEGSPSVFRNPKTLIALLALSAGIGIFAWLLASRSFSRLGRWLHRLTGHPWIQKQDAHLAALDDSLGEFYRGGKTRFLVCVLWHLAGWLAGALEVAIIFRLMGYPVTWQQAWFIGAMAQLAAVIGLVIPAGIGLYEGGHYMAASILGINPTLGLTVSLIRRVREVFWDAIGLFLFWKLSKEK
jgi:glycosyltransferase 2 family protein